MSSDSRPIVGLKGLEGWRHLALDLVGSTNTLALEHAQAGDGGQLWITAEQQNSGKGRRGREWVSPRGNLYASVLLLDPAPAESLSSLPLVAALALHDAILKLAPSLGTSLKLKWPNDLLIDGKKLSGILLEGHPISRFPGQSQILAVAVGLGVNCKFHPDAPLYPCTSLKAEGYDIEPDSLFQALAVALDRRLKQWDRGHGLAAIRADWLSRAQGLGERLVVRYSEGKDKGVFEDLDASGMLVLRLADGTRKIISAGDVFFKKPV